MIIIQEIQTTGGQTALHTKLGSAAISSVGVHTVIMYDEHGNVLRREYYEHVSE